MSQYVEVCHIRNAHTLCAYVLHYSSQHTQVQLQLLQAQLHLCCCDNAAASQALRTASHLLATPPTTPPPAATPASHANGAGAHGAAAGANAAAAHAPAPSSTLATVQMDVRMATQLQLHYTTLSLLCDLQYGRVHLYQAEGCIIQCCVCVYVCAFLCVKCGEMW